jgi:hypothetical protein
LVLRLDAALSPEHPLHDGIRPGEVACFKVMALTFEGVRAKHWAEKRLSLSSSADGSTDLGSVYGIRRLDDGRYEIKGGSAR